MCGAKKKLMIKTFALNILNEKSQLVVLALVKNYLRFINDTKEIEVPVEQAWNELEEVNRELEKYAETRAATEKELESCRQRGVALENVRQTSCQFRPFFF